MTTPTPKHTTTGRTVISAIRLAKALLSAQRTNRKESK